MSKLSKKEIDDLLDKAGRGDPSKGLLRARDVLSEYPSDERVMHFFLEAARYYLMTEETLPDSEELKIEASKVLNDYLMRVPRSFTRDTDEADFRISLGQFREAAQIYLSLIDDPESRSPKLKAIFRKDAAGCLAAAGDYDTALDLVNQALEECPNRWLVFKGYLLEAMGDAKGARDTRIKAATEFWSYRTPASIEEMVARISEPDRYWFLQ